MSQVFIEKSKSGLWNVWEEGGAGRNTGHSTIISDSLGNPKKPIFIKKTGDLSNGNHALIPIQNGDFVIKVSRHSQDYTIKVYSINLDDIKFFELHGNFYIEVDPIINIPDFLLTAIEAAKKKSEIYHCREGIYIQ